MRFWIGTYAYLTKITLFDLRPNIGVPSDYVRDDYDYLFLRPDPKTTVKIAQDGLIYLQSEGSIADVERWTRWLREHVLRHISPLDEEDIFYKSIFQEKQPTLILLPEKETTEELFGALRKSVDYRIRTPFISKEYGSGCVIFRNVKLAHDDFAALIENQIILADYQGLIKHLLQHNKRYWMRISTIRKQNNYIFKELPDLIDELLDMRRGIDAVLHRIRQLDDTLESRKSRCGIRPLLAKLKLDDYDEMIRLNNYTNDQFEMTRDYISSTIELIQFIYTENEQKELNILQVIFAIGTIASLVSLAGVSNDEFTIPTPDGTITGSLLTFDLNSMLFWTAISVVVGVVLFAIFNYVFLHAKKLRIVSLTKPKK